MGENTFHSEFTVLTNRKLLGLKAAYLRAELHALLQFLPAEFY